MNKIPKMIKVVERRYVPLPLSLVFFATSMKDVNKIIPCKFEDCQVHFFDGVYWTEDMLKKIADYQIENYKKQGSEYLLDLARLCEKTGKEYADYLMKMKTSDFSSMSNAQLSFLLEKIFEEVRKLAVFLTIPFSLQNFLDSHLEEILSKRIKDINNIKKAHRVLSLPIKLNYGQEEIISFYKIAVEFKKNGLNENVKKMIDKHLNKYSYLQVRWMIGEKSSFDDVVKRLINLINEDIEKKLRELKNSQRNIKKESDEICQLYNLTKEEKEFVSVVKEYVFIRTYRTDILNESYNSMENILNEVGKRFGINYKDLLYLTIFEIVEGLKNIKNLQRDKILIRKKEEWAFFRDGENLRVIEGRNAIIKEAKKYGIAPEDYKNIKEINGSSAWKGIVKGKAKIVLSPEDLQKVQKNDILLAVMTFPSYISAMEKASAFVTDEGGILCHAAIVSREMKKPCVIATKSATKIFKDNDLIEVDADKGIVRIIEKA